MRSIFLIAASVAFGWNLAPAKDLPNVIVIYADDLGYGDVQCYNPQRGKIPTPHIDRLAREGIRFTDAHSSSAVCSPSRYTLLTGRYHWRTRLQKGIVGLWHDRLIPSDRMTLGSLAKQHGYATACIGKWHLGWNWGLAAGDRKWMRPPGKAKHAAATEEHRQVWDRVFSRPIAGGPITVGFDEYFGTDVPNWPPFCFIDQNRTVGIPTEFLPAKLFENHQASQPGPALSDWSLEAILPALGDRAVDFIGRESKTDRPFLIYMPLTSPHTPLSVNQEWIGKSGLNRYADFVMETDAIVGTVLDALRDHGVEDETLVVFTSDNGCAHYIGTNQLEAKGHFPSGPLRGYKSDAWEGGHRVPFIVRWPGMVHPGGQSDQLIHQADLIATLAELLGSTLPPEAGEDSFSMLSLWKGGDQPIRDDAVCCSIKGVPSIRDGDWKLIFAPGSGGWTQGGGSEPVQLYNLADDIGETKNLSKLDPERVKAMTAKMESMIIRGRSTPGPEQTNDVDVIRYH